MKVSDEIINNLIMLFESVRDRQFDIGDYLIELVEAIGFEKSALLNYLAGTLHVSASTLYDYYRIAQVWTPALRQQYQHLDWTFYRNTNPNDPEDIALLEQAIDEGWNVSRMKAQKYNSPESDIIKLRELCRRIVDRQPTNRYREEILDQILSLLEQLAVLEREDVAA